MILKNPPILPKILVTLFSISITLTGGTTKAKAIKIFPHNVLLLKVDSVEEFSNQSKTDGMVNNHVSSCKVFTHYAGIILRIIG